MNRRASAITTARPRRRAFLATLLGLLAVAGTAGVADAATGVVWELRSSAHTTVAPGQPLSFTLWVTNVGDTATDRPITLSAQLPQGMTYSAVTPVTQSWDCSGTSIGATTVTCTLPGPLPARGLGAEQFPNLVLTVDVNADGNVSAGIRSVRLEVSGGADGAAPRTIHDPTRVTSDPVAFDVDGFDGQVVDANGAPFTQAGGHPDAIATQIDVARGADETFGAFYPVEPLKDVMVDLPPGFVGNPTTVERCDPGELANSLNFEERPTCPTGSQVGIAWVKLARGFGGIDQLMGPIGVYNVDPPPNAPARFGFNVMGTVVTLDARLRSDGDYGLSVDAKNTSEALAIIGTELTFWGRPADDSHDAQRSCPGQMPPRLGGPTCGTTAPLASFLRNPTTCQAPPGHAAQDGLLTRLSVSSWAHPGAYLPGGGPDLSDPAWKTGAFVSHAAPGYPGSPQDPLSRWGPNLLPTGCDQVPFDPSLDGAPTSPAPVSSPTAFAFDLRLPQDTQRDIATGDLRKAVVTLPAGVRVSPSSAYGLAGCSSAQIGLRSSADPTCPDASKIGTITVDTPLLDDPLAGSIYLASPHDNPFDSLLSIYLVARGPGVILKLPGKVSPDPTTGQLTTTFDDNPQLPFNTLHLEFKGGPRAPLVTPDMCGTYTTNAVMTSWSGRSVTTTSSFSVSADGQGGTCPATRAFAPSFHAGTERPVAGATSPFSLRVARGDQDQQLGAISVKMPPGLLGKIKNATLCSTADAARGACGEASRIGSVTVGAGAGPNPFYISNGRAYITEGYGGGAFGMSIVVPAVAGPFNLGEVNVRAAIVVDRETAELNVVSDPMPTILEGIPLDVRDVRVTVDKSDFIVNPTSCTTKSVSGTITSTSGATATGSTRFKVGRCGALRLSPRMQITVGKKGRTGRGASTPFRTVIRQPLGQTNLASVSVMLPMTLNARLNVVNRACTRAEFDAGNCEKARAGTAIADTPLLAEPLKGGAYFVRNGRPLPDLMIGLRGQVDIDLTGKVTIPHSKYLRTTFDTIPDAPITSFDLRLVAGSKGPIGVARNLCRASSRRATAKVDIRGQNGDLIQSRPHLKVVGCARKKAVKKRKRR